MPFISNIIERSTIKRLHDPNCRYSKLVKSITADHGRRYEIFIMRKKKYLLGLIMEGLFFVILQGVISSALEMVSMLYIRWRTYVNKVAMYIVKQSCLLNESTCIENLDLTG